MLGIALGLASSLSWGISDFLGGLHSRRISALAVLLVSQPVGLGLALAFALLVGGDPLSPSDVLAGLAAGLAGAIALGAFYRGMALGSVSVVAMIGALGVLVPVAGGLAQGEQPGVAQAIGGVAAIGGVILVSREPDREWRAAGRASIGLAALAALGFGTFFLLIGTSAGSEPAWTVVVARVGSVTALLLAAAWVRPSLRIGRPMLPALVAIGCFDVTANGLFALATNHGLLALVSVASSLYSLVTLLLARLVLGERLGRSQRLGVGLAIAGVAAIAASS